MNETTRDNRTGHCLCGNVTYALAGDPIVVAHCHCDDCQRLTGSGHSTGAMYRTSQLTLLGPTAEFKLRSESGNEVTRVFCPACGSPILGKNTGMDGFVTISLGTLDHSNDLRPNAVIFARNRRDRDPIDESIPAFDAQLNWSPCDT